MIDSILTGMFTGFIVVLARFFNEQLFPKLSIHFGLYLCLGLCLAAAGLLLALLKLRQRQMREGSFGLGDLFGHIVSPSDKKSAWVGLSMD